MKKIMYHIHKLGINDDMWEVGNTIDNTGNEYINDFWKNVVHLDTIRTAGDDRISFDYFVAFVNNVYKNEKWQKKSDVEFLLGYCQGYINHTTIQVREMVLEYIRQKYYPNLPSRTKCIWVCTEKELEHWKSILGKQNKIFKVQVEGDIFHSSDNLLPRDSESLEANIRSAHEYWSYDKKISESKNLEYLLIGKLEILEEIKKEEVLSITENDEIHYNLVRDEIPNIIKKDNKCPIVRVLEESEYRDALAEKIEECTNKIIHHASKEELMEICSDMLEVIETMAKLEDISLEDIIDGKEKKKSELGGFQKKLFLERIKKQ